MNENEKPVLPTNIKQIGSISEGIKIYVEDYVYTYIQQYASFADCEEKIGVLAGRKENIGGSDVLFINGAIQGKFSRCEGGMEVLTERSWEYIGRQMETYFPENEILGWIYIQPGYGDYLNSSLTGYHERYFKEYYNVLFICDPVEKMNGFFCRNEALGTLEPIKGYFIYYDRNEGMHEYMLENRLVKPKPDIPSEEAEETENVPRRVSDMRPTPRMVRQKGRTAAEQKKMINLLGTLSAVLFLVCFIMGAGLIQNDDRISSMEKQLAAMDDSYTYIISLLKEGNVQSVFAAQDSAAGETKPVDSETVQTSEVQTTTVQTTAVTETTETTTLFIEASEKASNEASETNYEIPSTYVVQEGDSLSLISQKFYGNKGMMNAIMRENNLENADMIYFGKVLYLPKP